MLVKGAQDIPSQYTDIFHWFILLNPFPRHQRSITEDSTLMDPISFHFSVTTMGNAKQKIMYKFKYHIIDFYMETILKLAHTRTEYKK